MSNHIEFDAELQRATELCLSMFFGRKWVAEDNSNILRPGNPITFDRKGLRVKYISYPMLVTRSESFVAKSSLYSTAYNISSTKEGSYCHRRRSWPEELS